MAGLDDLLGGLLGGGNASSQGGSGGGGGLNLGAIAGVVMGALAGKKAGGLGGMLAGGAGGGMLGNLIENFTKNGMGGKTQSWVGDGDNDPLTPDEVEQALGRDAVDEVAREAGVSHDEAKDGLAQVLPTMVDKLTPQGSLPSDDDLSGMWSKATGGQ